MIPRRVSLKGFLCYRDEQVIDFDGADLWVLSGRNGSGKSAVFDALTFALFGAHRGGKQSAARLINADSPGFEVVLDFDLGAGRYRIRRSLRRASNSGERLIHRREVDEAGEARWRPVPETDSKAGFEGWVREHVGLTYETFTSSVLLAQGQSEKLLGADHRDRYNVLAGVEDLARFERLARAADDRRVRAKARAEALRAQVRALPPVDHEAFEKGSRVAAEAESALEAASAELASLSELGRQAREWADLEGQRAEAIREGDEAFALLADEGTIRRDWDRLVELDRVVPALREVLGRRAILAESEAASGRLEEERRRLARASDLSDALEADMTAHLADLSERRARDEARLRGVIERLGQLAAPLERARLARAAREVAARIDAELAADPADHDAALARLEAEHTRRAEWDAALSTLEGLARDREGLVAALREARAAGLDLQAAEVAAGERSAACRDLAARAERAREAVGEARNRVAVARTIAERADSSLARFLRLDGASSCDLCGQPLTPAHYAAESARVHAEQAEARRLAREAEAALAIASASSRDAEEAGSEAARLAREAEVAARARRNRLELAEREATRSSAACALAHRSLPARFRDRVSESPPEDWASTTFPAPADLDDARRLVAGIGAVAGRRDEARRLRDDRRVLLVRRDEACRAADELGTDEAAEAALGAERDALASERGALARSIEGQSVGLAMAEATVDALAGRAGGRRARQAGIAIELSASRARAEVTRGELARTRSGLPDSWVVAADGATGDEVDAWEAERLSLRRGGVAERAGRLPQARFTHQAALNRLADLGRRIAAIPEEARRDPAGLGERVAAAGSRREATEAAWREAVGRRMQLAADLESRRSLEAEALGAERERATFEALAGHLGWTGLLRHRLREAERSIVDGANRFLAVISGGDLELRLVEEGDSQRALNLEVKDRTHGATRVVEPAYLSGSQKFRVAVSLALGIGQHARGAGRPIESVIIDESFGCLDRQGRREMIDQLGDLQGVLARIILVSHQEEIADAFPDGYRFEVIDGATVARPFHR